MGINQITSSEILNKLANGEIEWEIIMRFSLANSKLLKIYEYA